MPTNERYAMKRRHDQIVGNLEKSQLYLMQIGRFLKERGREASDAYQEVSDTISDLIERVQTLKKGM